MFIQLYLCDKRFTLLPKLLKNLNCYLLLVYYNVKSIYNAKKKNKKKIKLIKLEVFQKPSIELSIAVV